MHTVYVRLERITLEYPLCAFSFFFFFFLQSVHTRVYSNHREAIYISLFPCKSRPRVPGITTRDRSTLKYKDVNTGQASRNVSTREEGARRGAKISPASPCDERDSRERKKREFSKLILSMDEWIYVDRVRAYLVMQNCLLRAISRFFQYSNGSLE